MNTDTLILKINGVKWLMHHYNEQYVRRNLIQCYKGGELVEISDYKTGEVFEILRMDELFNY